MKLVQEGHLNALGAPPFVVRNIQECNSSTWSALEGNWITTRKGSRPGSPLADVSFMIAMEEVGARLEETLLEHDSVTNAANDIGIPSMPILWADDIALIIPAQDNLELQKVVGDIMGRTHEILTERGFSINYAHNKTEVLFTFCGPGAKQCRVEYLEMGEPVQTFASGGGAKTLKVKGKYRHLGSVLSGGGGMDEEIVQKIGVAWQAFRSLRFLLCKSSLKMSTRLRLFNALIMTKLLFGAGSWPLLKTRQTDRLTRCYLGMVRQIVGQNFQKGKRESVWSNGKVLNTYHLPDIRVLLAKERLTYAKRLCLYGGEELNALVLREWEVRRDSWLHGFLADLQWLNEVNGLSWGNNWEQMCACWKELRQGWKAYVRNGVRRHVYQEALAMNYALPTVTTTASCDLEWACWCGANFLTKRALCVHRWAKHQETSAEHKLVSGTICPACLKQFWSVGRLKQHLQYISRTGGANRCFSFLVGTGHGRDHVTEDQDRKPLDGWRRLDAIRCHGPLPFGACPDHLRWARNEVTRIENDLALAGQPEPYNLLNEEVIDVIFQALLMEECTWFETAMGCIESNQCSEETLVVCVLFAGMKHVWRNKCEQEDWNVFIVNSVCGVLLLEWFNARLLLGIAEGIENIPPHRPVAPKMANDGERATVYSVIPRTILLCKDLDEWWKPGISLAKLRNLVS